MRYLLSVYQPDGAPPPEVDLEKIMRDIGAINEELRAAGAWVFAGSLHDAASATVVRRQQDGELLITDGPYVEGKEHLGGFSIIEAADLDEALGWTRKFAHAIGLPIEVRPFREEH